MQNHKVSVAFGKAVIKELDNTLKKVSEIMQSNGCFGQVVNARAIASEKHIRQAAEQAVSAFGQGSNFSNRQEMELLIRLSGRKQVGKAVEALGVKEGMQEIAVIAVGENGEKAVREIALLLKLEKTKHKPDAAFLKKAFGIPENELKLLKEREKALESAVLEKAALVELED